MSTITLYRSWFNRFILYNLVFFCLQLGFILTQGGSFLHTVPLPSIVYRELLLTLGLHLSLYLLLSLLQTTLLWGVLQRRRYALAGEHWAMAIWSLTVLMLITTNAYFFPISVFSRLFLPELPHFILLILLTCALLALGLLMINTWLVTAFKTRMCLLIALGIFISFYSMPQDSPLPTTARPRQAPNIILIGVDSLRPNSITPANTPNMASFLQHSVQFEETISPLARTYPAWASILTGLYPLHHRARYNLMPPQLVKSSRSIVWHLRDLGYQTVYATDDRRFNSINYEFGFQKIIGPKLGVNDVLLGTFNDFPLSNLLINLPISRWLFPYNYMNRASHYSYYPSTFDSALHHELAVQSSHSSPLFIAVHFALPHWPYAWAASSPAKVKNEYSVTERSQLYLDTLQEADNQVGRFLDDLQHYGYLNHCIVVLLSDHGEALYEPGSRQTSAANYQGDDVSKLADYFKRKTSTTLEQSAGHGSDLLSSSQFHSLLAFQIYQNHRLITTAKKLSTRVALIDIAPTLEQYVGKAAAQPMDGISLLKAIEENAPLPERAFLMESGMLPNQFLSREQARIVGQQLFTVNEQGLMILRKSAITKLDIDKLYGIIYSDWLLALYPDDTGYIPVILRLSDDHWVDNFNNQFVRSSPALMMFNQLKQFYHKDWPLTPYGQPLVH